MNHWANSNSSQVNLKAVETKSLSSRRQKSANKILVSDGLGADGLGANSKSVVCVVALGSLLTLAAAPAFSQEVVGSIVGKVADEQGLVMPGVVIAVSSPNLWVSRRGS